MTSKITFQDELFNGKQMKDFGIYRFVSVTREGDKLIKTLTLDELKADTVNFKHYLKND